MVMRYRLWGKLLTPWLCSWDRIPERSLGVGREVDRQTAGSKAGGISMWQATLGWRGRDECLPCHLSSKHNQRKLCSIWILLIKFGALLQQSRLTQLSECISWLEASALKLQSAFVAAQSPACSPEERKQPSEDPAPVRFHLRDIRSSCRSSVPTLCHNEPCASIIHLFILCPSAIAGTSGPGKFRLMWGLVTSSVLLHTGHSQDGESFQMDHTQNVCKMEQGCKERRWNHLGGSCWNKYCENRDRPCLG